ncbi:2-acylglycerol O-acyltransferase 1 [Entophlyctis luteolus]|nr:2-acylglycerol O-acyltransferase 1 [Entophlyctis luteolus]
MLGTETVVPPLDTKFDPYSPVQRSVVLEFVFSSLAIVVLLPIVVLAAIAIAPTYVIPVLLVYAMWAYGVEGDVHDRPIWHHFRHYFRAHLVKTADLPAGKNYLLNVHPHGVYVMGMVANVYNNRRTFAQLFPGLTMRATTLGINFKVPLWREVLLSQGAVSVDRKSLEHVLTETDAATGAPAGNIVTLVVGGAEEFQHMEPGTMDLVLAGRKGFVKLALTTGASLVPLITFGENDTWRRSSKGVVADLNKRLKKTLKFVLPELEGRDGNPFMPLPAKLVTVIGKPIDVEQVANPTPEMVEDLHKRYVAELFELYDTYKDDFFADRVRDMRLVK